MRVNSCVIEDILPCDRLATSPGCPLPSPTSGRDRLQQPRDPEREKRFFYLDFCTFCSFSVKTLFCYLPKSVFCVFDPQYGIKKREEAEAEAAAAAEETAAGSLTRPKKAVPAGCGDEEEEEESIMDTVMKYLPGPLQDMLKK
uniref:Complexin-1 n=1 Tax=Oryzias sinensis TaxID=183150 RepID=A0A8C8DEZ3_9TELE